jgi:succinoglycan biosynthesis protein ExoA
MGSPERSPEFSVVIPCLNEEAGLARALESLIDDYVRERGEVLVVDGGSRDRTREIAGRYAERGWPLRLLDNPDRLQSQGMNIGIREASGAAIVRADAHALYPKDYVRRCVELLRDKGADNAGGVMWPVGETTFQKAAACAMRHPVGVGDARYHLGNYSGWNPDGVYLGAFRREVFEKVGFYDPAAHPNEDAELNLRMSMAGLKIWLDGTLRVTYFPRKTLFSLARQYFLYGRGRRYTTRKHRRMTSWRQAVPIALVAGLAGCLVAAPFFPPTLAFPGAYLAGLAVSALAVPCGGREPWGVRLRLIPIFATMHVAWALGFLFRRDT